MFWLTLARGIIALVLGGLLFSYPDKTRPLLRIRRHTRCCAALNVQTWRR
jgi:hypothetical protein